MPSYRTPKIAAAEITPERFFLDRRTFIAAAAGSLALAVPSRVARPHSTRPRANTGSMSPSRRKGRHHLQQLL